MIKSYILWGAGIKSQSKFSKAMWFTVSRWADKNVEKNEAIHFFYFKNNQSLATYCI